jgi:hypothetical protein
MQSVSLLLLLLLLLLQLLTAEHATSPANPPAANVRAKSVFGGSCFNRNLLACSYV